MATVQVLVPCYNYGRYLPLCVQSVLEQPGVDVDVLIIDDCSSDDTPDVCAQLAARDPRVRVIRHEVNKGHIATYNEGISQIRGDYFVLLSADDLLTPGALARSTALMDAHPEVGMTYGHPISFSGELPPARTSSCTQSVWGGRTWMRHVCRSGKNFLVCPEAVVRASIQERIGGYSPDLPHSGDMEMWLRIAAISDIGYLRGADQAYYRVHPLSMQRTVHAGLLFDLIGRNAAFQAVFQKEGATLPEREVLHTLAKKALASIAIYHARKLCELPPDEALDASPGAYREFAVSLWPKVTETFRYRALLAAEDEKAARRSALRETVGRYGAQLRSFAERELLNRIEWHWSRHTGTYFPRCYL